MNTDICQPAATTDSAPLMAGVPTGALTLELVAFDKSGDGSARYPYFTVR
ncbi:MAG TPA: hypothetical protein VM163_06745 [bacterium]|nr:hypothetical protein [bacterium]